MAKDKDNNNNDNGVPHVRSEPRPDFSQPIIPKKLPKTLQATLDDEEKLWEVMAEGR